MEREPDNNIELVRELILQRDSAGIDALLATMHPADVAETIQALETNDQIAILKRMENERAAEVLTEIDQSSGQSLLVLLSDQDIVQLLEEMQSDDAADIMATLPPEKTERVEALLSVDEREQLHELMEFDDESAGGLMEIERVSVRDTATIQDAIDMVREGAEELENLQKIFLVDHQGRLTGVINILDLILHAPTTSLSELREPNVISVPVGMDQEEVASLFGKYDEFTLPVVDEDNKLVGRITVDDIIDVIEDEASEDIAHIAGTTEGELGETSIFKVSRTRLPWLITSVFGQIMAAVLMQHYEASFRAALVLTFFVPLIVGTAGSIGIQAAVVVVRELALGQIDLLRTGRRVVKELQVALVNAVVLGALLFVIVLVWRPVSTIGDVNIAELGLLLSGSLMAVIIVAAFTGASVPLLLHRWKIDPGIAAGPFITVLNDIIGLAIYLSLASAFIASG